jgi:parallel beta-helix repeat protein
MRKLLIGIIILLLLVPSVVSVTVNKTSLPIDGNYNVDVITVDDEGDGDYTSIKDAVNNASSGDTIEVFSGTYNEYNIWITKEHINLIGVANEYGEGNDTGKPFINGSGKGTVIWINVSNVTVSNFRIENPWSGSTYRYPIRVGDVVSIYQENVIMSNNKISNSSHAGICCQNKGRDIKIVDNEISYCNESGILVSSTKRTIITGNTITDVEGDGLLLFGSSHNVSGNIIRRCENGINLQGNYNIISKNIIENCDVGVFIERSRGNTIIENNFKNYSKSGYWWYRYIGFKNKDKWNGNYWDSWIGIGPKLILGHLVIEIQIFLGVIEIPIQWLDFDWNPASEPYNIPGSSNFVGCDID